jgi:nitrogen-specific signal transduction histidine kinase
MALPLYGFLEGDTMGVVIIADEDDRVKDLADRLQSAADLRVAPALEVDVIFHQRVLEPGITLAEAGFHPLDRFDVRGKGEHGVL